MKTGGAGDLSWDWPLPATPYVPGHTPRPAPDGILHRLAHAAPDPTRPADWRANAAYRAGWRLFAHGYGWEAHEVWEPVWMHCRPNSAERYLMQGLIQLANARLKLAMGRPRAVRRLVALAHGHLGEAVRGAPAALMGVDLAALLGAAGRLAAAADFANTDFNALNMHYSADVS